jgi:hypothetical protein
MLRRTLVIATVFATSFHSIAQQGTGPDIKLVAPLAPLFAALSRAHVSGSLEFSSARCDHGVPADWPHWRTLTEHGGPPLQVAREAFADDPTIQVTQDANGTIRMIQNGVPTDLLDVRINEVPLSFAYSPGQAARAVYSTPEVAAFISDHHISMPTGSTVTGGPGSMRADLPHRLDSMHDVTFSEALDGLLRTFPGIWVYQDCLKPDGKSRFVWVAFFSSRGPGFYIEE